MLLSPEQRDRAWQMMAELWDATIAAVVAHTPDMEPVTALRDRFIAEDPEAADVARLLVKAVAGIAEKRRLGG